MGGGCHDTQGRGFCEGHLQVLPTLVLGKEGLDQWTEGRKEGNKEDVK